MQYGECDHVVTLRYLGRHLGYHLGRTRMRFVVEMGDASAVVAVAYVPAEGHHGTRRLRGDRNPGLCDVDRPLDHVCDADPAHCCIMATILGAR